MMNHYVSGVFNGTGATLYVCLGFIPDFVKLWAHQATSPETLEWNKQMRSVNMVEGFYTNGTDGVVTDLAAGAGIAPYFGGDLMTTSNQTSVTYAEGVYLDWDDTDYRYGANAGPGGISGDAVSDTIDTWTLDTAGSRTGHFNGDLTGTYTGVGSRVCIDGKWYTVTVLAAGQGVSDDEVTLNLEPASGEVSFVSGRFTHKPLAVGKVSKSGFRVSATTTLNVNDEVQMFEAGCYTK